MMQVSKQPRRVRQSLRQRHYYSSSTELNHPQLPRRVLAAAAGIIINLLSYYYYDNTTSIILFHPPSSFLFQRRSIGVGFISGVGATVSTSSPTTTTTITAATPQQQQQEVALEANQSELALLHGLIQFFTDREDIMATQILLSQTPQGKLYPSYRYQLSDFLSAITHVSTKDVAGGGVHQFYMGEVNMHQGVRYGVVNAILFLAQAYKESIQYDACDENNWQLVNDLYPLSNACGQLGMSYQDMVCTEDEAYMECLVQADMEQVAITNAGWFQAPAPFKCGPKSKV